MVKRQSLAQKRIVRKIQRWLAKHEYTSGYGGLKLYRCGTSDDLEVLALCRSGVVVAYGGGCYVDPWVEYTVKDLKKLFNGALSVYAGKMKKAKT